MLLECYGVDIWDLVMCVNVNSVFYLIQVLLLLLCDSDDGCILFIFFSVGCKGWVFWGVYVVFKVVIENLLQMLVEELENIFKICVNIINSGVICMDMCVFVYFGEDVEKLKSLEQIVVSYLYLLGFEGVVINGQFLDVQFC